MPEPITELEAIVELNQITHLYKGDTESIHDYADDLLCRVLQSLGYEQLVEDFHQIKKWYA